LPQGVNRELYQRLATELRGERALRRGWEAECRRVLEQNRVLRRLIVEQDRRHRLEDAA
jgi:hypothetical protein